MRILLTGKNGQLGFELRRSLAVLGDVHAVGSAECDLENPSSVCKLLRELQPDVIVNSAAYTAVDRAESEPERAVAVNARAPGIFAEAAERTGALLVHFSTDYVFDGSKIGAYVEADAPNPQSVYGASKLAGEHAIQSNCARHLILRTSWVVGPHGGNFAKTMLRLAAERDALNVVADQWGAPTSAPLLADITAHLVLAATRRSATDFPFGLYHCTASGRTNWHAYACHVIERARAAGRPLRLSQSAINAVTTADYPAAARRPVNSELSTAHLRDTFNLRLPDWRQGLDHVLEQIFEH